jgi:TnpA family transposase
MKGKAINKTQRRLRILGDDEIQAIYGIPRFTPEERLEYFSLSSTELASFSELHSIKSQIYYIIQLGYFKARQMFFVFDLQEVLEDARYIIEQYFPNFQFTDFEITKVTRLRQQRLILKLYNYRNCGPEERQKLASRARQAASVCAKPVYVFRELMHYLQEQRIVAPGYSFLQDTIGKALTDEQERLTNIVHNHLNDSDIEDLNRLLEDSTGLYEITQLKREPKDFNLSEIKREIHRSDQIGELYKLAQRLLPHLLISNESIKYYASLVSYYSVYKLKRFKKWTTYVYLLCFVYHRYQRCHDNLILSLIHHVRQYDDEAKAAAKECVYQYRIEANQDLQKAGQVLKLFTDDSIAEQTPFHQVQAQAFSILQPIKEHLKSLEQMLEERITCVNQRIAEGLNEHFQIKKRGQNVRWALTSPRQGEPVNHPLFDAHRQVEISSVMNFVNQQCRFMEAFEHILGRYVKQEADERAIIAVLIAWGTNMGLGKMGDISDIGYQTLASTSDNFIRIENLREANDLVSNAITKLPIFQYYDLGDALHSSSDGQKFETQIHTINARYSQKYFGLKKGIVSYTLVANHVPLNAEVIGANEHESHYVFDILYNNTTDIQPEVHSTDTHGPNEVNFAILHFFGYQFAPRYNDIHDKVSTSLYGFKHPSQYGEDMLIKPIRKINSDLIIPEWENIQRIMVSLALKTTTQSIIIGKLSNYARKNKTRRALWEYDNIIRSLYLLDYIDSPPLRSNVQTALNRGENYHQLRRAVSYANFGKLRFKTEYEQQIWNECARLITNCIIYYNATILSHLLSYKEKNGDVKGTELLKRISPVAWKHINFCGRYEFSKMSEDIDIDAIIHQLAQVPVQQNIVL